MINQLPIDVGLKSQDVKVSFKDHLELWRLFLITIVAIYFLPQVFNYLLVLAFLYLFLRSDKDYLWLALVVLLNTAPMGLFSEMDANVVKRLPLFRLGGAGSFTFFHLFFFVSFLKALNKDSKVQSFFTKHYAAFIVYIFFLVIIAFVGHQRELGVIFDSVKKSIELVFIFVLYKLVVTREDKYKFFSILLPFGFVYAFDGIYFAGSGGKYFYYLINPTGSIRDLGLDTREEGGIGFRFLINGFILSYLIFMWSLVFALLKIKNRFYLFTAMASFLTILIGAMRSWFVIYSISFMFWFYYSTEKVKSVMSFGLILLISMIPILTNPQGFKVFQTAFNRIGTIYSLGDESSAATQSISMRLKYDVPIHMNWIRESPITGWGFTEIQGNGDIGNIALLVDVGYMGFFLFLWFWLSYFYFLYDGISRFNSSRAKNPLRMLGILFCGMLLSHFTTNTIFSIYGGIFYGVIVFFTEFVYQEASIIDAEVT